MAKAEIKLKAGAKHLVECLPQGVERRILTDDELVQWLDAETQFWQDRAFDTTLHHSQAGQINLKLTSHYARRLLRIKDAVSKGDAELLRAFLDSAAKFEIVIGQGRLGQAIAALPGDTGNSAVWVACALSPAIFPPEMNSNFQSLWAHDRAMIIVSPAFLVGTDVATSQAEVKRSRDLADMVAGAVRNMEQRTETIGTHSAEQARLQRIALQGQQADLTAFVEETKAGLASLHELYHKQMQTEAAATYWEKKSNLHRNIGWSALAMFVVLILVPFTAGVVYFEAIRAFLVELTAATADKFSLTPIVALSIPVLGYGWLLRHISRLFIQNLTLADDASYRRVMSMTFLGLSKDPASGISDAERAIILNALFRPAPPNSQDEGPPSGLLDMLKPKL